MDSSTRSGSAQAAVADRRGTIRHVDHRRTGDPGLPAQRVAQQQTVTQMVLVADPGRESREVLTQVLRASGIGDVAVAESAAEVGDVVAAGRPGQLALVSLAFGAAADKLIDDLRRASWPRVIALAPTADPDAVVSALQAGACGVLRGHPSAVVSPDLLPPIHQLTEREIEVLTNVADGRSNLWIGAHLSLSALTIKSHLARISRKLGTGDRAQMVAITMRAGLIR